MASAGHLPAMIVGPDRRVRRSRLRAGPPLGAAAAYPEGVLTLGRGETVLLYTDGLIERRGVPIERGFAHLRRTISRLAGSTDPEQLCAGVSAGMLPDGQDDIAVLAATRI